MNSKDPKKINILAVARWPSGGIRTYMNYTYKYLTRDRFKLTILVPKDNNIEVLRKDAKKLGARLIFARPVRGKNFLFYRVFQLLCREKFEIIQSHGFISATHVYIANQFFRIPHILTVHGIVEESLLGKGIISFFKKKLLERAVNGVDVLYGVSEDILQDVANSIRLHNHFKHVVIHNAIDTSLFGKNATNSVSPKQTFGLSDTTFVIGFLGRFMPEKGFNFLIDAVSIMETDRIKNYDWKVLAVGSADFLREYKETIKKKGLKHRFTFIPFQQDIVNVYKIIDLIVMPSIWEAFGLQAAEALCLGIPIIVSDCIGLRETVKDTPAIVVPRGDATRLAESICNVMLNYSRDDFKSFQDEAIKRFDVRRTSAKLAELFESVYSEHYNE